MRHPYVVLFDQKAGMYNQPIPVRSMADAERMAVALFNDETKTEGQHPEDFFMYHVGDWVTTQYVDREKADEAEFITVQGFHVIGRGIDFVKPKQIDGLKGLPLEPVQGTGAIL